MVLIGNFQNELEYVRLPVDLGIIAVHMITTPYVIILPLDKRVLDAGERLSQKPHILFVACARMPPVFAGEQHSALAWEDFVRADLK